ncbi:hypothetical protein EBR21_05570, partial [bacterium]|nr:hypothetical protein [bacterium]
MTGHPMIRRPTANTLISKWLKTIAFLTGVTFYFVSGCKQKSDAIGASANRNFDLSQCFSKGADTNQKVDCLNRWISEQLIPKAEQEVGSVSPAAVPLKYYSVSVCGFQNFSDRPKWLPAQADLLGFWNELDTNRQRDLFSRQIYSAIEFIKTVHKSMHGIPIGWFKEIVICPRKMLADVQRSPLELMSGKLFIWSREQAGGYQVLQEAELLRRWNSMDFESDLQETTKAINTQFAQKASKAWAIVNPIGTLRTNARAIVFEKLTSYLKKIDEVISAANRNPTNEKQTQSAFSELVSSMASESAQTDFSKTLSLAKTNGSEVACMANAIKKLLKDSSYWQQQEGCTSALLARQIKNSVTVKDVVIYVGNLH